MDQEDATWANSGGMPSASTAGETKRSIGETASQTYNAALDEAKSLGSDAKELAEEKAEKAKETAASQMDVFADALRAASDQLSKDRSGMASEMVAHAASGLEGLARSLHGSSTGEMLDKVREFGRTNPIGFLAGSVLAGVALGRFSAAGLSSASDKKVKTSDAAAKAMSPSPRGDSNAQSAGQTSASQFEDRGVRP